MHISVIPCVYMINNNNILNIDRQVPGDCLFVSSNLFTGFLNLIHFKINFTKVRNENNNNIHQQNLIFGVFFYRPSKKVYCDVGI